MIHLKLFARARHWMLIPLFVHLLVSLPIFAFLAYSLWTVDLVRLLLGLFVLASYCGAAWVLVKMAIAIDEQYLRHLRLKPDGNGHYERPLDEEQVKTPFDIELRAATSLQYAAPGGIPLSSQPDEPYQGYAGSRSNEQR